MFTFLLVVHGLIAAALVGVILVQKSEGGGLGMGSGSPAGLMTARGAADFLTRATTVLAGLFIVMALALAAYASVRNRSGDIDTSLAHQAAPGPINAPTSPTSAIPMIGAAPTPAPEGFTAPAPGAPANGAGPAATEPAPAPRAVPSVKALRTIDTHVGNSTVGIRGVGNDAAPVKVVPPSVSLPAPKSIAPKAADAPVKIEAPAPAAGNSAQP